MSEEEKRKILEEIDLSEEEGREKVKTGGVNGLEGEREEEEELEQKGNGECPICFFKFPFELIEKHVNDCMEKTESDFNQVYFENNFESNFGFERVKKGGRESAEVGNVEVGNVEVGNVEVENVEVGNVELENVVEEVKQRIEKHTEKVNQVRWEDLQGELREEEEQLRKQTEKQKRENQMVDDLMILECKQLLSLFGIPFIQAPGEAEAQCAFLNKIGIVDGVVTNDSDAFLFGTKKLYKNFFNKNAQVEEYSLIDIQRQLAIDTNNLIQLAQLLGSDYAKGIEGVGIVFAVEILSQLSSYPGNSQEDTLTKAKNLNRKIQDEKEYKQFKKDMEENFVSFCSLFLQNTKTLFFSKKLS